MKKIAIAGCAFALTLGLVACSSEESPAPVVSGSADVEITDESADAQAEGTTEEQGDASGMVPVGTTVNVADWDVTVTKVAKNADKAIASASSFNDKAEGQYVMVTYDAVYQGDERKSDVEMDLTWSFTGADKVAYETSYEVTPSDAKEAPTQARKGGSVTTEVLFDVPAGQVEDGIISVQGYDANLDSFFADFSF